MDYEELSGAQETYTTYRKLVVVVTSANATYQNKQYILDSDILVITGVSLNCEKIENESRIFDLNLGLRITGVELLPDDVEATLLATSLSVPPANRFLNLNQAKGSGKVEIRIKDRNSLGNAIYPYNVFVTLRCTARTNQ